MATLKRKESDGGYYTVVNIGAFVTYQVSPKALPILRRNGISEGDLIPRPLIDRMRAEGLLTTGGSGITEASLTGDLVESLSGPKLAFVPGDDDSWALAVALPEISPDLLIDLTDPSTRLSACGVAVGERKVSALKLWPGVGGYYFAVEPSESSYQVRAYGDWPQTWDLTKWTGECTGISDSGDVFDEDGNRLRRGIPVGLGQEHFYVVRNQPSAQRFPKSLSVEELQAQGDWSAFRLRFPDRWDIPLQHWLTRIGHPVTEEEYRLTLVSPPALAYGSTLLPVLQVGTTALIGLEFVGKAYASASMELITDRDEETIRVQRIASSEMQRGMLEVPLYEPGTYRIRARSCPSNTVAFRVAPVPAAVDLKWPRAARVLIALGRGRTELFEALTEPSAPTLEVSLRDDPKVAIPPCPAPMTMRVSHRGEMRRFDISNGVVSAEGAIRSVALSARSEAGLIVDAGAYGRVQIRVRTADSRSVAGPSMPVRMLAWLDRVAAESQADTNSVSLTDEELSLLSDARLRLRKLSRPGPIPGWLAARVRSTLPLLMSSQEK